MFDAASSLNESASGAAPSPAISGLRSRNMKEILQEDPVLGNPRIAGYRIAKVYHGLPESHQVHRQLPGRDGFTEVLRRCVNHHPRKSCNLQQGREALGENVSPDCFQFRLPRVPEVLPEEPVEIPTQVEELHLPCRLLTRHQPAEIRGLSRVGSDSLPGLIKPSRIAHPHKKHRIKTAVRMTSGISPKVLRT
jgi:hypothetical protein